MTVIDFIQVVSFSLLASSSVLSQAATPSCELGWFGTNCDFQCHCAGCKDCHKVDGSCSSGCQAGWFGPGCQYVSMDFSVGAESNDTWLSDMDESTCNVGSSHNVTVVLATPVPLSRIRLIYRTKALFNQIKISYQQNTNLQNSTSMSIQEFCTDGREVKADARTMDIYCSTPDVVFNMTLSGPGVENLCSMYISGGRNMALKQPTEQSSLYLQWYASHAVDGKLDVPNDGSAQAKTCTHTNMGSHSWWRVNFTKPVQVTRFRIYNRRGSYVEGCCGDRLINFSMTIRTDSDLESAFIYRDTGGPAQDVYTFIPSPAIRPLVSQVRIDLGPKEKILTLCEVEVFGDCVTGTYGSACSKQCSQACAGADHACDQYDGACYSCSSGYIGKYCDQICPRGRFGPGCNQTCRAKCTGQHRPCHPVDGTCYLGEQSGGPSGFGWTSWSIVTVGAIIAVAGVIIGVLSWRLHKASSNQPYASDNEKPTENVALVAQGEQQDEGSSKNQPDHETVEVTPQNSNYDTAVPGTTDVHEYNTGFDVYENTERELLRDSGTYLVPVDVISTGDLTDKDDDEKEKCADYSTASETAPYGNMSTLMSLSV